MRDITLEDTVYFNFTTRAFATGIPTQLGGTPALSVLESNNATPITAGVSVSVDRATVTGLNQATVVATAANGYESGKSYAVYISTGTVGGVSVVGEVVAEFTIQASAAAVDLANATDGLGALKTLIDTVDNFLDTEIAAIQSDTAAILLDTGTDGVVVNAAGLATDAVTEIADGILARDIGSGSNALTATNERTVRSALRFLRNMWSISGTTLTVTTENDSTTAWQSTLTGTAAADPITATNPD